MALKINKNEISIYNRLLKVYHNIEIDYSTDIVFIRQLLSQYFDLSLIDRCEEFYIRIDRQIWDKKKNLIVVNYYNYNNEVIGELIESLSIHFEHDANPDFNMLDQGYNYLKTLPEFEGAIDC